MLSHTEPTISDTDVDVVYSADVVLCAGRGEKGGIGWASEVVEMAVLSFHTMNIDTTRYDIVGN